MAAVPVADPSRRHKPRALLEGEIPEPHPRGGRRARVPPLVQVAPGPFRCTPRHWRRLLT
jgi:glutathione transport system ATP-binding protein